MLEGITVLSESIHQFTLAKGLGVIIICLIISVFIGIMGFLLINDKYFGIGYGTGLFLALIIIASCKIDKSTYTIYKVTISDEVNFVEFTNRYEVLSQDGQIYEIREKETE